jgi:type II pantothenate kinase
MSVIGIDIGSSTTKIIEYKNDDIVSKKIIRRVYERNDLDNFIDENNIKEINKIVFTGIGTDKLNKEEYDFNIEVVEEFDAIGIAGKYLSKKDNVFVVSVGTGTAIIEVNGNEIKHLGGTGVGAGTLFNLCNRYLNINSYDELVELAVKGNIEKIDLRIGDVTDKEIKTLPKDLTLANFGKFELDSTREDKVLGFVNMVFEVIGMMVAFAAVKSECKDAILIGNIVAIPGVKEILKKIEFTHKMNFIVLDDVEFAVALGAVIKSLN